MTAQPNPDRQDELYSEEVMSLKRNILMDLLFGCLNTPRKESSVDLWKAFVDTALDRLENDVYLPFIQADRQAFCDEVEATLFTDYLRGRVDLQRQVLEELRKHD